jgi:AbrB family looped-hinge helix DNA binding protein
MGTASKHTLQAKVKLSSNGRLVIPSEIREELGFKPGDTLYLDTEDGSLRIETFAARILRVQQSLAKYLVPGHSLVDELIAERREEARREEEELQRDIREGRFKKAGLIE